MKSEPSESEAAERDGSELGRHRTALLPAEPGRQRQRPRDVGRKSGTGSADGRLLRLRTVPPSRLRDPALLCSTEKPPLSAKGFFWTGERYGPAETQKPFDPGFVPAEVRALSRCLQPAQRCWGRASPQAEGTKGSEACAGTRDPHLLLGDPSGDPHGVSPAHPTQGWGTGSRQSKRTLRTWQVRSLLWTFSVELQEVHC